MRTIHRARLGEMLARGVAHALRDATQMVDLVELTGGRSGEGQRTHAETCQRLRDNLMLQVTVLEAFALTDRERVTPLSVADVVEVAARLARRAIGPTATALTLHVSRALPPAVGIAADISEACYALLVNAVEALATQGGGTIVVNAAVVDDVIEVRITDDGPGVPQVVRESGQLFEAVPIPPGLTGMQGIGLPVARYLARRHGGDVVLEEREGRGTTVLLRLLLWRRSAVVAAGVLP